MISSLNSRLVGNVAFPITNYLYNRKGVLPAYRGLLRTERYPAERLREMQMEKLGKVLDHAYRHVPYYRELFRGIGLHPRDIRTLDDVERIPPLSREDVIQRHGEMVDERFRMCIEAANRSKRGPGEPIPFAPFRRSRLVRNTSSGSTGAPTIFYEDGSRTALNWAYELRLKRWYDVRPGEREARMARLSTIYDPDSASNRMRRTLWNQMILPGTNLTDREYAASTERIRKYRPVTLWGYTSALTGLASYLERNSIDPSEFGIQLVISWAAPLYEHENDLLKRVFRCAVTNIYGAREVGHIAAVCPAGSLHLNQENLYVESERTGEGSESIDELLVTNLDPSPMPFLRYRMGDIGRVAESNCGCGRTLQVIWELLGRTGEIFVAKDGRMISPNFWCRVFMSDRYPGHVSRFQVVYTKDKNLRIRIVKGPAYGSETEGYIRGIVRDNFSTDTRLAFDYLEEIKPHVSGKYQMVVNEDNSR